MSKPAFLTHPIIHVTGHEGSLSLFLAALIYHATNPGVPAPKANRYDHSWFGEEIETGGYYNEWLSLCYVMDQNPSNPVTAALNAESQWQYNNKYHVIESTKPEDVMEQLFSSHKHIILYSQNEDRYQIAHNYIMLDCLARRWEGFETIVDQWNQTQQNPITRQELYTLFNSPDHLDNPVTTEILTAVGNAIYINTLDPEDEAIPDSLDLFYSQYSDPAQAQQTIKQITDYLGDLVVVDSKELENTLIAFLKTIQHVDYAKFAL